MEAISTILSALATATTEALAGETGKTAIQDTYNGLKSLIKRKFSGDAKAEMVLEEYESDPETYEVPLKKKLTEVGADRDEEIINAAKALLEQLELQQSSSNKYQVEFQGEVKGAQFGDNNTQNNTFS